MSTLITLNYVYCSIDFRSRITVLYASQMFLYHILGGNKQMEGSWQKRV